jgi:hypothetical protein
MKQRRLVAVYLIVLAAAATGGRADEDRSWMMPVSEIKEGMKGYGLSVFQGTEPERFDVEIVGVLHNTSYIGAGFDMILARFDHPKIKDAGVIRGMSGSPVFLNDRMIGAVAYGFPYSKVAVGGITPIEKMYEVYRNTPKEAPPRDVALGPFEEIKLGQPVSFEPKLKEYGAKPVRVRKADLPEAARQMFGDGDEELQMAPISMPVLVSSCSPQTADILTQLFKPFGITPTIAPVGAAAGAGDGAAALPLKSGTALGIPMLMGDLSVAGIGTATYVNGEKMVAFGHPMYGFGPVQFPMGMARIVTVMPSVSSSFKIGEVVGLSGSIHEDRLSAIGGILGKIPFMVPIQVTVKQKDSGTVRTYNFKMADHRLFSPRMAATALTEACAASDRVEGDMTLRMQYTIETDDGQKIDKNLLASGSMAPLDAAMALLNDLAPIYSNSFTMHSIKSLSANIELSNKIRSAEIQSAFLDRTVIKPGQTLSVSAYVRPWLGEPQRVSTTIQTPPDLPEGRYNVVVCDSRQRELAELSRAPGLYRPRSYNELIKLLGISFPSDRLYVMITSPSRGITIDGQEFRKLPPSVTFMLGELHDREKIVPTMGEIVAETSLDMPYVIEGGDMTQIGVDRRGGR